MVSFCTKPILLYVAYMYRMYIGNRWSYDLCAYVSDKICSNAQKTYSGTTRVPKIRYSITKLLGTD